jgi:hypothetical protein
VLHHRLIFGIDSSSESLEEVDDVSDSSESVWSSVPDPSSAMYRDLEEVSRAMRPKPAKKGSPLGLSLDTSVGTKNNALAFSSFVGKKQASLPS